MNTAILTTIITIMASKYGVDRKDLSCSLKLSTNYQHRTVASERWYGIGLTDHITIKAWKLDKDRLTNNIYYSVEKSAEYLRFVQDSYKEQDFTSWQCSFRNRYTNRSSFCMDYMVELDQCKKEEHL